MDKKHFTFMDAVEYAKNNFPCKEAMFTRNNGERIMLLAEGRIIINENGIRSLTFEDIDYEKWKIKMIWEK